MNPLSNPSTTVLIAVIIVFLLVTLGLLVLVIRQSRRIGELEDQGRSKYGFLGKPIGSAMIVAVLVVGFGATYFASRNVQEVSVSDMGKVEVTLTVQVGGATASGTQVDFKMVPLVDGVEWAAAPGSNFDAFWTITGPEQTSQIELGLNAANRGGFIKVLDSGSYQVTVDVLYLGKTVAQKTTITVP